MDEENDNHNTKVVIKMPSAVYIELVQANELKHYELFQWLVALFLPIAVGFWTAYFTGNKDNGFLWSAFIFTLASLLFIILAIFYRHKVFSGSIKKIAMFDSFKNDKKMKDKK